MSEKIKIQLLKKGFEGFFSDGYIKNLTENEKISFFEFSEAIPDGNVWLVINPITKSVKWRIDDGDYLSDDYKATIKWLQLGLIKKTSKTFSIRIKKYSTKEEMEQDLEILKAKIIKYVLELPSIDRQVAELILQLKELYQIIPTEKEIREFLTNEKIKYLRINEDFSNHNPSKGQNGGCYGYWEELHKTETVGLFKIIYNTTSTFLYCPACGRFSSHEDCQQYQTIDIRV